VERVTLWHAASLEEAIALADAEAHIYAEHVSSRYVGLAQAHHLADDVHHDASVYSLMRLTGQADASGVPPANDARP
jgi:hypothetical protein